MGAERKKCTCGFAKQLKFSPDYPSGKYKFMLNKPSDRSMVKCMIQLAASMDGDNMRSVRLNGTAWHDFNENDREMVIPDDGTFECEFVETKEVAMSKQLFPTQSAAHIVAMLKNLAPVPRLKLLKALC